MRVLITGATGMDGQHLASALRVGNPQIEVWGAVRHPDDIHGRRLDWRVKPVVADLCDYGSLVNAVRTAQPHVIYHLGALSAPTVAWQLPELCGDVTGLGTLRLLRAAYESGAVDTAPTVIVAGSIAMHGPYGAAKEYARIVAADFRNRDYPVTTIVMGGHHSYLRSPVYLTKKVALHARAVHDNRSEQSKLELGPLDRVQDFGWAPDFMEVWSRAHGLLPDEYLLSTGQPRRTSDFVAACYAAIEEDWKDWVTIKPGTGGNMVDVPVLTAQPDPGLGFDSKMSLESIAREMVLWP